MLSYSVASTWRLMKYLRAERKKDQVCSEQEYKAVFRRIYQLPRAIEHLVLLTGAYPVELERRP